MNRTTSDKVYNPFYPWSRDLLMAMMEAGHKWFVRQYFKRGWLNAPEGVKACFIISHYNDQKTAEAHLSAIHKNDPNAYLYDVNNPDDKDRLIKSTDIYLQYRIYSNTVWPDWKERLAPFERLYRSYIDKVLNWSPSGKETVYINIFSQFGEVFATLKYSSQKVRIKLSDLEGVEVWSTTSNYRIALNWLENASKN